MKKIYLLILPLLAIVMACSGPKTEKAPHINTSKKVTVDSFYSADLTFADIRGQASQSTSTLIDMEMVDDSLREAEESLKTISVLRFDPSGYLMSYKTEDIYLDQPVDSSHITFEFDDKGNLTNSTTDFGGRYILKRNAEGYVVTFTCIGTGGDMDYTKYYTWDGPKMAQQRIANDRPSVDKDGNPLIVPSYKATYKYDDKGYRTQDVEESGDPELQLNITTTDYTYNDFDEHGNWTNRDIVRIAKVYSIAPSRARKLTDSVVIYQSEVRDIKYYK